MFFFFFFPRSCTDNVCLRPWSFERVPNRMIRGLDNALIYTSTKEACLAACLNEVNAINMCNYYHSSIIVFTKVNERTGIHCVVEGTRHVLSISIFHTSHPSATMEGRVGEEDFNKRHTRQ